MSSQNNVAHILDLTSQQTLFELAIESSELIGRVGARMLADLKERASDAHYTHMYYRDPIRPGIVWLSLLEESTENTLSLPTRGRLDQCRKVTEGVFPGFIETLENSDDEKIMSEIPPITTECSGFDLVTALEYLVFVYPTMVRGWAALIFAYDHILNLKEGAESARKECISVCPNAQIVPYLTSDPDFQETPEV